MDSHLLLHSAPELCHSRRVNVPSSLQCSSLLFLFIEFYPAAGESSAHGQRVPEADEPQGWKKPPQIKLWNCPALETE